MRDACSKLINFWGLIITAVLTIFLILFFVGYDNIWNNLQHMNEGTGAMLGAFLGLFAILLGALANAHLNRKRDIQLRNEEKKAIAAACKEEIAGVIHSYRNRLKILNSIIPKNKSNEYINKAISITFRDVKKIQTGIIENSFNDIRKLGSTGVRAIVYFRYHLNNFSEAGELIVAKKDNYTDSDLIKFQSIFQKELRRSTAVHKVLNKIEKSL